jgi:PAS domain S-box-containing protein
VGAAFFCVFEGQTTKRTNMQSVPDKWYNLYRRISLAIAALLAAACGASIFLPQFSEIGNQWGLTFITLGLLVIQIVYILLIYPVVARKTSVMGGTFLIGMFQLLTIITLIQASGKLHSKYMFVWGLLVLAMGMFGSYAILGSVFMTFIYIVAIISNNLEFGLPLDLAYGLVAMVGISLTATISHFIWKTQYTRSENQRLAKLSGMLANKDQQAEILIESIADGVVLINTEGKISLMNSAAANMSEWPIDEALGIDVQLVMKMKTEDGKEIVPAEHPFARALINREKLDETFKLAGRNGKEIIISLVVSPVVLPGKKEIVGMVAVIRDVSSAKAEENRRADFVSTASHEMRTPVAAIEGYLQLALNDKVAQIDAKARSYLEKALDSSHHLGQLFQDLLTSAKAEDGRLVSHPVPVEMGAYLEELSDSLKFSAEKKGLLMEFIVGVSEQEKTSGAGGGRVVKPLYYVLVDPDRLREVITNIFDNAVKYTDTGKVSIGLTGNTEVVQFYIQDTGPGISPEDVPHLFQKFYRVDNSSTRTIGGTGLGLFICKKIVELYKGRIWVESTVGQGSTFYMNFPRISSQKAAELLAAQPTSTL